MLLPSSFVRCTHAQANIRALRTTIFPLMRASSTRLANTGTDFGARGRSGRQSLGSRGVRPPTTLLTQLAVLPATSGSCHSCARSAFIISPPTLALRSTVVAFQSRERSSVTTMSASPSTLSARAFHSISAPRASRVPLPIVRTPMCRRISMKIRALCGASSLTALCCVCCATPPRLRVRHLLSLTLCASSRAKISRASHCFGCSVTPRDSSGNIPRTARSKNGR